MSASTFGVPQPEQSTLACAFIVKSKKTFGSHFPLSRNTAPVRLSTMSARTFGAPHLERPNVASVAQANAARRAASRWLGESAAPSPVRGTYNGF